MAYPDWKLHGDETLAAYLPDKEFKGILEKRIAVPPDCAALLIRDGQLVQALHGGNFSVGGLWQSLKNLVGGSHALRLLVADLKPFQLMTGLEGFTKDRVAIQAEVAFELQLDPEKLSNILGLVANGRSLVKADVLARIAPHLRERVFVHELVQHDAGALRANRGLQDRFQADAMREVERIAGDLGLLVRAVSVNWALNADEAQQMQLRNLRRAEELREFDYERARRELERETGATTFRLHTELDIAKVKAAGEAELGQLLARNQLDLADVRATGERIAERKALQHELELAKDRRLSGYDARLGDETNELERKKIEIEKKRLEIAFSAEARRLDLELKKLEQMAELEVAGAGHELQMRKLGELQDLELKKTQALHGLDKDKFLTQHQAELQAKEQARKAEIERMQLQAAMTPDQILAIQAGLSPAIAAVFAEKAKAGGVEREALLREMLAMSKEAKVESAAQAEAMFTRAVDRLAQVGAAKVGADLPGGPWPVAGGSECPKCHFKVPVGDRFCKNCGHQMRT
jgi:hypothetical protein